MGSTVRRGSAERGRRGPARAAVAVAAAISLWGASGVPAPPAAASGQATYTLEMISPITAEPIYIQRPTRIASNTAGTRFIAEGYGRIIRVDASSSTVVYRTPDYPIGNGTDWFPGDIAADEAGNLYIADRAGHRIQRLTPNGDLSVVAGAGAPAGDPGAGFDPTVIAVGRDGFLYSVDADAREVLRFAPDGTPTTMVDLSAVPANASGEPFGPVDGLAIDTSGDVHFCDRERIFLRSGDGSIEPFILAPRPDRGCSNLGIDASGAVFVTSFYVPSWVSIFPGPAAPYPSFDTMGFFDTSVRGDGTIDVVGANSEVFSLPPNGSLTTVSPVLDSAADSYDPIMISRGADGTIQMAESSWHPTYPVRELAANDAISRITTVGPFSRQNPQVYSLAVGADASYLMTNGYNVMGNTGDPAWQGNKLTRIDGASGAAASSDLGYQIQKVHVAPDGSFWYQVHSDYPGFTDPVLVRRDASGGETMMLGQGVGPTVDDYLTGFAFGSDGTAYFTENGSDAIHARRPGGSFEVLTHLDGFPVDVDQSGRVLVVSGGGGLAWAETDGTITSIQVPGGFPGAVSDAVVDGSDLVILVKDGLTNRVARLRLSGGGPTTTVTSTTVPTTTAPSTTSTTTTSTTTPPVDACTRAITAVSPANHVEGLTARLYMAYFLRQPDVGGYDYWSQTIASGASARDLSWGFAESTEFQIRYASLSNRGFVDLIYANVMCRVPDGEGYDYWLGLLNRGEIMRSDLMLYFADSTEFTGLTGTPP